MKHPRSGILKAGGDTVNVFLTFFLVFLRFLDPPFLVRGFFVRRLPPKLKKFDNPKEP